MHAIIGQEFFHQFSFNITKNQGMF